MTRMRSALAPPERNTFCEQLDLEHHHQAVLIPTNMLEGQPRSSTNATRLSVPADSRDDDRFVGCERFRQVSALGDAADNEMSGTEFVVDLGGF